MYKKFLALGIIFVFYTLSYAEDITITTYYPSPYGVYNNLDVRQRLTIGGTTDLGGNNYGTISFLHSTGNIDLRSATSGVTGGHALAVDLQDNDNSLLEIVRQNVGPVAGIRANGNTWFGGNVGIGTTTPTNKLDVSGGDGLGASISVGQMTAKEGSTQINEGPMPDNLGRSYFGSNWDDNFWISTFDANPNANFSIGIGDGSGGLTHGWTHQPINWNGMLILNGSEKTWMPSAGVPVSSTARADMVIDVNGDVGIGTTNPAGRAELHRFEVNMGGNIGGIGGGDNDYFSVNKDRNIGLELRSGTTGGTPYIDFSNDAAIDTDARLILARDDILALGGPPDQSHGAHFMIEGEHIPAGTVWPISSKLVISKCHSHETSPDCWDEGQEKPNVANALEMFIGPDNSSNIKSYATLNPVVPGSETPLKLNYDTGNPVDIGSGTVAANLRVWGNLNTTGYIDLMDAGTGKRSGSDWTPALRDGGGGGNNNIAFHWTGSELWMGVDGGHVKTFVIDHPLDNSKYLVHATLEGPEAGVYYRGTTKLKEGMTEIKLPDYFEALTALEGRSVQLTPIDGFDRLSVKKVNGQQIYLAKFTVYSDNPHSEQEFNWEVKAVRKDVPPLTVEPDKNKITVLGEGPYTYYKLN